jgi:predicted transcriptional regulator
VSSPTNLANEFLELASEQRLGILFLLSSEKLNLATTAKRLDATPPELHRNLGRLQKAGLIKKDTDGNYDLTLYGRAVCAQMSTFGFMLKNKAYFENHVFEDLNIKYIQRIGALLNSELVVGYVKVMEQWENIYKNAQEYISNVLIEAPYSEKLLKIIDAKLTNKIRISSIFSDSAIVPKQRRELLAKFNFSKFTQDEILQRRMIKNIKISLILNEKEAGLSFSTVTGEPDLSKMFYSTDKMFHEWCLDLFNDYWKVSSSFQEAKIMPSS